MDQLPERGQYCPFLNRTDARCGDHFHLERLDHAFEYCFDRYTACPVYLELLVERRIRRLSADVTVQLAHECSTEANDAQRPHAQRPHAERLVQIQVAAHLRGDNRAASSNRAA